jgi:hypothetical protein
VIDAQGNVLVAVVLVAYIAPTVGVEVDTSAVPLYAVSIWLPKLVALVPPYAIPIVDPFHVPLFTVPRNELSDTDRYVVEAFPIVCTPVNVFAVYVFGMVVEP